MTDTFRLVIMYNGTLIFELFAEHDIDIQELYWFPLNWKFTWRIAVQRLNKLQEFFKIEFVLSDKTCKVLESYNIKSTLGFELIAAQIIGTDLLVKSFTKFIVWVALISTLLTNILNVGLTLRTKNIIFKFIN